MTHARWIRLALGYLSLTNLQLGLWALFAPQSFHDDFPGFGRAWISSDGPFNEHLIRDFGALNLALLVVFVSAAVTLSRPMVLTAAGAALVWGVPHLVYHVANTGTLATSTDVAMSIGGLAFFCALPLALIFASGKLIPDPAPQA